MKVLKGLPTVSLSRADLLTEKLNTSIEALDLYGRPIVSTVFLDLCQRVTAALNGSRSSGLVVRSQIESTLSYLIGEVGQYELLRHAMRFLAVNHEALKHGEYVMPGSEESPPKGWTLCRFTDVQKAMHFGRPTLMYGLRVEWGPWYGVQMIKHVESMRIQWVSRKLGLSVARDETIHPRQLVGMYAFVDPVRKFTGKDTAVTCRRFEMNQQLIARNRSLHKERDKPCSKGLQTPCWKCPVGQERCHRAVRPLTIRITQLQE